MSKVFLGVLLSLAGALIFVGTLAGRTQNDVPLKTLSGEVLDSAGGAIAGAQLTLLGATGNVKAKATTDSEGQLSI